MKKIINTALFLILPITAFSQDLNRSLNDIMNYDVKRASKNNEIGGSPYLENNYSTSSISNVKYKLQTKYNVYSDEIEFLAKDGTVYILPKEKQYSDITFDDNTHIKLINNIYYVLLHSATDIYLLKKYHIILDKQETEVKTGYSSAKNPEYIREKPSYFIYNNTEIIELDKSFGNLLNKYKDNNLPDFIKKQNVTIKNEKSLFKIVDFLSDKK
ncbi:hypothetical protein HZP84_15430 [Elizabethkingia anophelis]|uniref:hypothetical protein n=1 Tax=Elizabethkingia anophelis TaxID=1117645 RepID=UPI00162A7722|nr:hypothetical protein [Elizabethkingia anophelis]MCT3692351.1 hypothetical protein [Elizabethkingia anophelis]MCT3823722.1 hypothetical protein [Elizabethkingia anophelis]MCT3931134.1 hypothetical protein [Elizabethkingia anophelis]MCT4077839.1 hypothetical protein [Elizabethkingia anophelis]MCT4081520.1 hypothetical protein [Elizabethkingia anophelis]